MVGAPPEPGRPDRRSAPCDEAARERRTLEETSMKIRPLQDRILVKRIEEEDMTKGGIIIPDSAKEKPQEGKVVAVGKGKVDDEGKVHALDVKKGDKVLFSKYAGTEVNIEGEEHLIIREDDVLGVLE
jgi:chaperonin GroES